MSSKLYYRAAWFILLATVFATAALVVIPVYLIQPFAAQTKSNLDLSFFLKNWSPILTVLAALVSIALCVFLWTNSKRWFSKALIFPPLAFVLLFTWFARQNHFEWMFNPLSQTAFVKASEANFVADEDVVMAVEINGDAVAFPIRQMAYHHVVQEVVGGTPITATY